MRKTPNLYSCLMFADCSIPKKYTHTHFYRRTRTNSYLFLYANRDEGRIAEGQPHRLLQGRLGPALRPHDGEVRVLRLLCGSPHLLNVLFPESYSRGRWGLSRGGGEAVVSRAGPHVADIPRKTAFFLPVLLFQEQKGRAWQEGRV